MKTFLNFKIYKQLLFYNKLDLRIITILNDKSSKIII